MPTVLSEERPGFLVLTLDAESRGNSVDRAMLGRLEELLRGIDVAKTRAVVLRGAGEKSFCTGYNIEELVRELGEGPSVVDEAKHPLERALRAIDECPVPTIALVHGHAYGAGCELACACDLRVAAADAKFCMPPAKLGVLYSASGVARLVDLIGVAATREMFFTAEPIAAERALVIGLANRVVAKTEATAEAEKLATAIAGNAPLSVRGHKTILRKIRRPPLEGEAYAEVLRLREECFKSRDFAEAAQAFLTKRKPSFEGR